MPRHFKALIAANYCTSQLPTCQIFLVFSLLLENPFNYIHCWGGVSVNKPELMKAFKQYKFLEKEVPKVYVERNADKNSTHYAKINTRCTRDVGVILSELKASFLCTDANTSKTLMLVK